ncbi:EamA family transporter [Microbacterium sp. PRC9]|uniref:EamA family transporter n=1 Tax=Microbacterium sp. PRC9 TaxID=2962591 RepID=UPI0037C5AC99
MNAGADSAGASISGGGRSGSSPAILLVIAGLACQEVGASIAVLLFPQVGPLGILIALRRLPAAVFAILMSLAPATAALAGFIFLGQHMTWLEVLGIALVIAASIGAIRSSARAARESAEPIA